jgi:hypothetical protein
MSFLCRSGTLIALSLFGQTVAASSLCTASEKTYFACALSSGKIVSLCAARTKTVTATPALQYRFGRPGKIELRYPVKPSASEGQPFALTHYFRYQTDHYEVSFSSKDTRYVVFDRYEEGTRTAGVSMTLANGEEKEIACKGRPSVTRLAQLKDKLPCDRESALSLGSCEKPSK